MVTPTQSKQKKTQFLDAVIVCMAIAALALAVIRIVEFTDRRRSPILDATDTVTVADYAGYVQGHRIGPRDAEVTIVEFGDYRCPFCASAALYLRRTVAKHSGRVALLYRHYPSDSVSYTASLAATCADSQGRFDFMHHLLYSQPDSLGIKPWAAFAVDAGVQDPVMFEECMLSEHGDQTVVRDTMAAAGLGTPGVPTFLINDLMVKGFHGEAVMDALINEALRGIQ